MGITQNTGASSLIKPGVIDSAAARPASPYEGQVIFQKDTDQLLVWNGTAWVIPNSPAQNPEGLELITTGTRSSADAKIEGCFSSTYDSYRILIFNATTPGVRAFNFQLLSGSTALGSGYNYGGWYVTWGALNGTVSSSATTIWNILTTSTNDSSCQLDIHRPFIADQTTMSCHSCNFDAILTVSGNNTNASSYDGWRITNSSSDTSTFSYAVYGYRK